MADYQGEKFKIFLQKNKIGVGFVAEKLDVSRQTIYQYFNTANLTREVVNKIIGKLGFSEEEIWGIQSTPVLEAKPLRLADPFGYDVTGEKIYELNDGSLMMEVPIITQRARAGYLSMFADPEYYEDLPTTTIMVDKRAFSTYMAFEIVGDSMVCYDTDELAAQTIRPGWRAVGRMLDKSKWKYKLHTHNYDAWILVHKTDGILCKAITHHDVESGTIVAHSLNPAYPDKTYSLDDMEQIFSIVKIEQDKR